MSAAFFQQSGCRFSLLANLANLLNAGVAAEKAAILRASELRDIQQAGREAQVITAFYLTPPENYYDMLRSAAESVGQSVAQSVPPCDLSGFARV